MLIHQSHPSLADDADGEDDKVDEGRSLRYVFPFYPRELDILIGHLQTEVRNRVIDMYDSGDSIEVPTDRDDKLELIAKFRDTIREKEAALEKCRFNFWT
ncbi:unnamed protein product, partial [Candidula unifasciata]